MRAKAAIVAGVTAAVLGGGGLALAQADDGTPATGGTTQATDVRAATTISRAKAEQIALAAAGGGSVRESEMEFEEGALVWKIQVIAQNIRHDVYVDAHSGDVVRHRLSSADGGNKARHKDTRDDDDARHDTARDDDGPNHDVGDDHGGLRRDDDGPDHDAGDDHGGRGGDDHGDNDHGGRHGGDDDGHRGRG